MADFPLLDDCVSKMEDVSGSETFALDERTRPSRGETAVYICC